MPKVTNQKGIRLKLRDIDCFKMYIRLGLTHYYQMGISGMMIIMHSKFEFHVINIRNTQWINDISVALEEKIIYVMHQISEF